MELIKEYKIGRASYGQFKCCNCGKTYDNRLSKEKRNIKKRKIYNNEHACTECVLKVSKKILSEAGKKALKAIPKEKRLENCSKAGKISATKPNSGRFTTERWNSMSPEEQRKQVNKANQALHKKLEDPEEKKKHFEKIFKQKCIGYQSSGHHDLHDNIKNMGFDTHVNILGMEVDECNEDLKIVIEYNGDFWHCNPQKWKKDDYNSAIKMTAGEKWAKDIARKKILTKMGYSVIVVWESDWEANKEKYLNRIKNEVGKKRKN